jgi:hypothetical protein
VLLPSKRTLPIRRLSGPCGSNCGGRSRTRWPMVRR